MIINASGLQIDITLRHMDEFVNLSKYETLKDDVDTFRLDSQIELPKFEKYQKICETKFYDVYETELGQLQVQTQEENIIGYILYNDKHCTIYPICDNFVTEYLLSQYVFVYWIRKYSKSIFIHSSSVSKDNIGLLLCAKSGTGKSTHRRLWEKFGGVCINDDKNVISLIDDKLYIMPNPWCGKHFVSTNLKCELTHVVFLYQNKENVVSEMDGIEVMKNLLGQIQLPTNKTKQSWNEVVDRVMALPIYKYGCNMEDEAFEVLYRKLSK